MASGALSSVGSGQLDGRRCCRPSNVQKLQRMATSPSASSKPMPVASNAPRPMTYCSGSYPNSPKCPGPLPGAIPGRRGCWHPARPAKPMHPSWAVGSLQFRRAARRHRQSPQPVGDQHDDLVPQLQFASQAVNIHRIRRIAENSRCEMCQNGTESLADPYQTSRRNCGP
jgi:hypothetical protein